jgi:hypothetical protein
MTRRILPILSPFLIAQMYEMDLTFPNLVFVALGGLFFRN